MKWLFLGMMAGIAVVMGTDAGNIGTLHGPSVFHEMAMMQQACLSQRRDNKLAESEQAGQVARAGP